MNRAGTVIFNLNFPFDLLDNQNLHTKIPLTGLIKCLNTLSSKHTVKSHETIDLNIL